jgi:hypothetical protein
MKFIELLLDLFKKKKYVDFTKIKKLNNQGVKVYLKK